MNVSEIRKTFLEFFASKNHTIVSSSPVVPGNDPTLLFTNAGMNQFKDVYLGFDRRPYDNATTAQKCIRAGGKHNDLDNVGYTARHHTFFEMLGNFSFGGYFKHEAIAWAWELLTDKFHLPPERLWVTVYAEDDEAYDIWNKEVGVPAERIVRIGDNKGARYMSDNFWMMGDTGPCGPCSEIFYDHGEDVQGGPPGSPDEDGDRYIEIWNLVFNQYFRDEKGVMHPLPRKAIDTGMGLERIAAVLQGVHSNYEIDLFVRLLAAARKLVMQAGATNVPEDCPSLRVIADHIRACSFAIADGVVPGNAGRGYVLRRIIRRAIRHGYKLGARDIFFAPLCKALAAEMGEAYPELLKPEIQKVLETEERRFAMTLGTGMQLLEAAMAKCGDTLDGDTAFKLHDTYGFPLDLTADVCRERNIKVDQARFDELMEQQRSNARAAGKFRMAAGIDYQGDATVFTGYGETKTEGAKVVAIFQNGEPAKVALAGDEVVLVLDKTPFYAEMGGQVGDTGELINATTEIEVFDTTKIKAKIWGHSCRVLEGSIRPGDVFTAKVNEDRRASIARNHSVTHLMHKALRTVLGDGVAQRGSEVTPDHTRFDFSCDRAMTLEEIHRVEALVNEQIMLNTACDIQEMDIEEARKTGAMMLFGEKYGSRVRVVSIGNSIEFCGGTHIQRTGDIGFFKILGEGGISAGVRRIEAVTGKSALALMQTIDTVASELARKLKVPTDRLVDKVISLQEQVKTLEKQIDGFRAAAATQATAVLSERAKDIKGAKVVVARVDGLAAKGMRESIDKLRAKLGRCVIVLGANNGGKVQLAVGVAKELTGQVKAGELVNSLAAQVGGKGGGKPDMAMAGGSDPAGLDAALAGVEAWLAERL